MKYLVAAVWIAMAQVADAQTDAWLCISDKAAGFSDKYGSWNSTNFNAGNRYIIKASKVQGTAWEVREFGDQNAFADAYCKDTFTASKILNCSGIFTEFHFNAGTGRFMRIYYAGYWTYIPGDKNFGNDGGDTPVIAIGTCSGL
jgi:hypothetical protein